tara:strand:- start:5082 stop:6191 length:1110 start_codon:yes stop_codon:yes gene_type:complete
MMKKNISHVITGLGTGGAERFLLNLLEGPYGSAFNHSVISLTTMGTYGSQLRDLGIDVRALRIKTSPWAVAALPKLVRDQRPDIVQGWMYHGNLAASFARPHEAKLIWNVLHGLDNFSEEKRKTRLVIQANAHFSSRPEKVLFNAEISRQQHLAAGFCEENSEVIPNGFDFEKFYLDSGLRAELRKRLCIPAETVVIGHLGRFHPVKDHGNFLQAGLAVLANEPDVHLLLAGQGVEYATKFFHEKIPKLLRPRVHLLGDRRDVPSVLSAMDIFTQSSRAEGFPNVLGEAMSTGLACIATSVGDSAFVLDDTGLIVRPESPTSLETAMRKFLADPSMRRISGERARERIKERFPLDSTAQAYISLCRSFY